MKLYHYDDDGVFTQESEARRDPMEKQEKYLIPRNATTVEPPGATEPVPNTVCVFHKPTMSWLVAPDYRGSTYWDEDAKVYVVKKVGVVPPLDAVWDPPPEGMVKPKYIDGEWQETHKVEPRQGLASVLLKKNEFKKAIEDATDLESLKAILLEILFDGDGGENGKKEKPTA